MPEEIEAPTPEEESGVQSDVRNQGDDGGEGDEPDRCVSPPLPRPSEDQQAALDRVFSWTGGELTFGGYAGTGKTTCLKHVITRFSDREVAVCALAGKAVSVLRRKGIATARTIHSTIYRPIGDIDPTFELKAKDELKSVAFFAVDEASMVSSDLARDLRSFGKPILWVGDHGQLEPVGENPGLMLDPQIRLEKIHRQALASPVLTFATAVRLGQPFGSRFVQNGPDDWVKLPVKADNAMIVDAIASGRIEQAIVGYNDTRHFLNRQVREALNRRGPEPEPGDRVICLRNNYEHRTFNGMMGTVKAVKENRGATADLDIDCEGLILRGVRVLLEQFGRTFREYKPVSREIGLWDYGYAITCHKARGSEWESVLVIEQLGRSWDPRRWAYTAATRASRRLVYITGRTL